MIFAFFALIASKVQLGLTEERQFVQWMRTNSQFYTGDEYHLRLGIFITNARYVQQFNQRADRTFRLAINKFSCHTPAEYQALLGVTGSPLAKRERQPITTRKSDVPDSIDWREKGLVTRVRTQGACAAGWAISAVTTAETAYAIHNGTLLEFSEQNIVDCAYGSGCSGGWPEDAIDYVLRNQNGKFNSPVDYPYTQQFGSCKFSFDVAIGRINRKQYSEAYSEESLKESVGTLGVASICLSAGNAQFMQYSGGILDDDLCEGARIDHAAAAVGYGTEDGVDYWIVKNCFGTDWGEEGYVRMIRNKNNRCRLADNAFVAIDEW